MRLGVEDRSSGEVEAVMTRRRWCRPTRSNDVERDSGSRTQWWQLTKTIDD